MRLTTQESGFIRAHEGRKGIRRGASGALWVENPTIDRGGIREETQAIQLNRLTVAQRGLGLSCWHSGNTLKGVNNE